MNTGEATTREPPLWSSPFQFSLRKFLGMLVVVALVASCVATLKRVREAARRSSCESNLRWIALGLHDYWVKHRSLPPAYVPDSEGTPVHSWRVLSLPDDPSLYNYDFNEAWNGPSNRRLLDGQSPPCFACPSDPAAEREFRTSYVAVIGENTLWPGARGRRSDEMGPNVEEKIVLIEIAYSDIAWTEPRDITVDEAVELFRALKDGRLDTQHGGELHYATFGLDVRPLSEIESVEQLREMLTIGPLPPKPGQAGTTAKTEGAKAD